MPLTWRYSGSTLTASQRETKTIAIRVNAKVARIFEAASEEQRCNLEALLSLKLSDATRSKRTLKEVMIEISRNAQARGLTLEILDSYQVAFRTIKLQPW